MLFLYAFGLAAFALLTPALVDVHWSLPAIGSVVKIFGSVIGLLSAVAAGRLLRRQARRRSVRLFSFLQAACLLFLLPVLAGEAGAGWVCAAVTSYFISFSPPYAALSAVMMDKAAAPPVPATAYTVQNALAMFLAFSISAAGLWLAQQTGYVPVLLLCIACVVLAALLSPMVIDAHKENT